MTKGVNFSSCPDTFGKCYCEVNIVDGIMRAARFTEPCISTEGCISSNSGTFTFEGEPDPGNSADFDEVYEDDDRERFEDAIPYPESVRSSRRRLLQAYNRKEAYGVRENRLADDLGNGRGYRSVPRNRIDDDTDYDEDEEEEEENDETAGAAQGDKEEEDEVEDDDEDDEETIGLRDSARGRWSPRKRTQEERSDYAAIALEGKPEVNELGKNEAMEIRSVTEDCEEDTTEPLQYYDYGEEASTGGD
ncbi:uncharacterized protein LOC143178264 isoform X2 [Calliopsis andreniformis]|uniref:uncharacterized protein LOC143178264 isoform X2 n=1 Tax=Calliopsis andreniformis TaxID=337506 RepID=UPI003FCCB35C